MIMCLKDLGLPFEVQLQILMTKNFDYECMSFVCVYACLYVYAFLEIEVLCS